MKKVKLSSVDRHDIGRLTTRIGFTHTARLLGMGPKTIDYAVGGYGGLLRLTTAERIHAKLAELRGPHPDLRTWCSSHPPKRGYSSGGWDCFSEDELGSLAK